MESTPTSATPSPTVLLDDVHKTYRRSSGPGYEALRGVTFQIARGECVALMGASGSGKTTILNLLGGLDQPDRGTVTVNGKSLRHLDDNALSRFRLEQLGYVFQAFNLLPHLTVEENVAVPLLLAGKGKTTAHEAARKAVEAVNMGNKLHRRPYELSGGEMQRVAIARAVVHEPAVLLADEPTGNLDSNTGQVILELMRRLNQEMGITILLATHSEQCLTIANRVLRIRDGLLLNPENAGASDGPRAGGAPLETVAGEPR